MLKGERMIIEPGTVFFPQALSAIPSPVKRLFLIGNPTVLQEGLAVIGARKATPYGLACAQRFSALAARKNITIISGGAVGCDAAAHKAALDEGGSTLVFLGGGCDRLYPKTNSTLFQRIIDEGGAIASEYEWDHPPLKYGFRARNRLIAGLAKATLIVEAGLPSGTFTTADEALDANREVLVVPGSIASKTSRGANRLLYQGAIPIVDDESFEDILFSLFGALKEEKMLAGSQHNFKLLPFSKIIYEMLCAENLSIDELLERISKQDKIEEVHFELMQAIIELEQKKLIARYPDGRYGVASF